jgi:hypothetical protein
MTAFAVWLAGKANCACTATAASASAVALVWPCTSTTPAAEVEAVPPDAPVGAKPSDATPGEEPSLRSPERRLHPGPPASTSTGATLVFGAATRGHLGKNLHI